MNNFLAKITVTHTITSFPRRRESTVDFVIFHFRAVDSRLRGNDDDESVCGNGEYTFVQIKFGFM